MSVARPIPDVAPTNTAVSGLGAFKSVAFEVVMVLRETIVGDVEEAVCESTRRRKARKK